MQHTFFVHFFAVVLHDYNAKLPETFFYGGNVVRVLVHFSHFTAAHFLLALVAASSSQFVTATTKFSCCSYLSLQISVTLFLCRLLSLFLCLSLTLYSKFVNMTIYLSLIL